jgi:hypothetical protein
LIFFPLWQRSRCLKEEKFLEKKEFLVPRGADISQPAYRPLNQWHITRTQSTLDRKSALNGVIVVRITHTPLTTYIHTTYSFVVFAIASSSRPWLFSYSAAEEAEKEKKKKNVWRTMTHDFFFSSSFPTCDTQWLMTHTHRKKNKSRWWNLRQALYMCVVVMFALWFMCFKT